MSSALFALFLPDRTRQKQHGALAQLSDGGEAFLSAARDDRSQRKKKKKNTWWRTSRLKNDGCFIGYVADRATCPFFGLGIFSWNKARQGERRSGSSRNMFYFFFQYWSKIAASFPSWMFLGRDVQDGSCRLWALFIDSPRAVVLNATKIPRRPFKGWIQAYHQMISKAICSSLNAVLT